MIAGISKASAITEVLIVKAANGDVHRYERTGSFNFQVAQLAILTVHSGLAGAGDLIGAYVNPLWFKVETRQL